MFRPDNGMCTAVVNCVLVVFLLLMACNESSPALNGPVKIIDTRDDGSGGDTNDLDDAIYLGNKQIDPGGLFIIDSKGMEWDVTHAVEFYGFEAAGFQFGIGLGTIPPIMSPQFCAAGDPEFPDLDGQNRVIGSLLNGEARAYALTELFLHEVANETVGPIHAAVGY